MRSKSIVPVGQGCRRMRDAGHTSTKPLTGRCACHPDLYLNICLGCQEWFHSPMPQAKTCSDRCRKRLSRSRNDKFFQMVLTYAEGAR